MLYFDYHPKEVTENQLFEKTKQLFDNSTFVHGDTVKIKGDINSPIMMVTEIDVKTQGIISQKYERRYIFATCEWFNKSKQDFSVKKISVLCLEKVSIG